MQSLHNQRYSHRRTREQVRPVFIDGYGRRIRRNEGKERKIEG